MAVAGHLISPPNQLIQARWNDGNDGTPVLCVYPPSSTTRVLHKARPRPRANACQLMMCICRVALDGGAQHCLWFIININMLRQTWLRQLVWLLINNGIISYFFWKTEFPSWKKPSGITWSWVCRCITAKVLAVVLRIHVTHLPFNSTTYSTLADVYMC